MSLITKLRDQARYRPWLGRAVLRSIPDMRWQVPVPTLGKFEIRLRRNRNYWLRPPLNQEGFLLGALERLTRPGDVAYDLGANIGLYSRFFAQKFKASRVYAFEPMSENRPQLERNLELGGVSDHVFVLPYAVGDADGTTTFQVDDLTSNSGALNAVTHGDASRSRRQYGLPPVLETVQVTRLDTLIASGSVPVPDVMKIDVEGAEVMALRGARALLTGRKPKLAVELHDAEYAQDVLRELWALDYFCFGYLQTDAGSIYKKLLPDDLPLITGMYTLGYLAASPVEADLTEPILDPVWLG